MKTKWDDLDIIDLERDSTDLAKDVSELQKQCSSIEVEYNIVKKFHDGNTRLVSDQVDQIQKLDNARIEREDECNIEMDVYAQKVQHIKYQYNFKATAMTELHKVTMEDEEKKSENCNIDLERKKSHSMDSLYERQVSNTEEIRQMKERYAQESNELRKKLEMELETHEGECQSKERDSIDKIIKRRQKCIRDVEEQCNFHLNELERKYQETHNLTKSKYSDIESNSQKTIDNLKKDIESMKRSISEKEGEIDLLRKDNASLNKPLVQALEKVIFISYYIGQNKTHNNVLNVYRYSLSG